MGQIEKLEKDIQRLEDKLAKDHFGGVVDQSGRRRDEKKLKNHDQKPGPKEIFWIANFLFTSHKKGEVT